MNIGEKIRNLRLSKLMTQKELAGGEITRNMLSSIENGAATPSLQTLIYIANRLGVPVGYLVSESGAGEAFYKKYADYQNIVKSYKSGEWEICRDLCLSCLADKSDNELTFMLANASMQLGISSFNTGSLRFAVRMFEESLDFAEMTVFDCGSIITSVKAYAEVMSRISPTLSVEIHDAETKSKTICMSDICKYVIALFEEKYNGSFSANEWENPVFNDAVGASLLTRNGNYEAALALLPYLSNDNSLPRPITYFVLSDYEKCCKETEDYKNAYDISMAKMQLFEKLLADI